MAVLSVQCQPLSTRGGSVFEHGRLARNHPPLGQGSRAAFFVGLSINEMAFKVEVVVNIGMDRGELLKRLHSSESQRRPLPSSKG